MLATIMNELLKGDDPRQVAEKASRKYLDKGYNLDFSLKSLENEIDKILETEKTKDSKKLEILESELTAYIGETLCRIFNCKWKGEFYFENSGMNFYTCMIEKNGFEFGPSHFIGYYLNNGKKNEGSFKDYLHSRDQNNGIFKDFLGGGLIKPIKNCS